MSTLNPDSIEAWFAERFARIEKLLEFATIEHVWVVPSPGSGEVCMYCGVANNTVQAKGFCGQFKRG